MHSGDIDENLTRAGGKREQDALPVLRDSIHHPLDRDVLIVAARVRTALIFEEHGGLRSSAWSSANSM